jgi:allantoin racemase
MKILICRTNRADEETIAEHIRTSRPLVDAEVDVVALKTGPDWTVCEYDAGLIAIGMYDEAEKAEEAGYDAYMVGSCSDSNARGIKELLSNTAVVEPGAAAMSVASFIADSFSVITVQERGIKALVMKSAQRLGLESKLASIRYVQSATEVVFPTDAEHVQFEARQMVDAAKAAVEEDGAEAVIFYSISYRERGVIELGREMLDAEGYEDLPLIDPACVALNYARLLVSCGLKQSKLSYPTPPTAAIRKF